MLSTLNLSLPKRISSFRTLGNRDTEIVATLAADQFRAAKGINTAQSRRDGYLLIDPTSFEGRVVRCRELRYGEPAGSVCSSRRVGECRMERSPITVFLFLY